MSNNRLYRNETSRMHAMQLAFQQQVEYADSALLKKDAEIAALQAERDALMDRRAGAMRKVKALENGRKVFNAVTCESAAQRELLQKVRSTTESEDVTVRVANERKATYHRMAEQMQRTCRHPLVLRLHGTPEHEAHHGTVTRPAVPGACACIMCGLCKKDEDEYGRNRFFDLASPDRVTKIASHFRSEHVSCISSLESRLAVYMQMPLSIALEEFLGETDVNTLRSSIIEK